MKKVYSFHIIYTYIGIPLFYFFLFTIPWAGNFIKANILNFSLFFVWSVRENIFSWITCRLNNIHSCSIFDGEEFLICKQIEKNGGEKSSYVMQMTNKWKVINLLTRYEYRVDHNWSARINFEEINWNVFEIF